MATQKRDLVARYIEPDPRRPGPAGAPVIGYGVAIWALVGYLPAAGRA